MGILLLGMRFHSGWIVVQVEINRQSYMTILTHQYDYTPHRWYRACSILFWTSPPAPPHPPSCSPDPLGWTQGWWPAGQLKSNRIWTLLESAEEWSGSCCSLEKETVIEIHLHSYTKAKLIPTLYRVRETLCASVTWTELWAQDKNNILQTKTVNMIQWPQLTSKLPQFRLCPVLLCTLEIIKWCSWSYIHCRVLLRCMMLNHFYKKEINKTTHTHTWLLGYS